MVLACDIHLLRDSTSSIFTTCEISISIVTQNTASLSRARKAHATKGGGVIYVAISGYGHVQMTRSRGCCCCCCCSHINSHNQVRGHRTGSSHSGAEEYRSRGKTSSQRLIACTRKNTGDTINSTKYNISSNLIFIFIFLCVCAHPIFAALYGTPSALVLPPPHYHSHSASRSLLRRLVSPPHYSTLGTWLHICIFIASKPLLPSSTRIEW